MSQYVLDTTGSPAAWQNSSQVLLSTTTLGGAGTFDVSGISQAYNDLTLVLIGRGTNASTEDILLMRFNNDSGANYDFQRVSAFGGTTAAAGSTAQTAAEASDQIPAGNGTANYFGFVEVTIMGYASTSWIKRYSTLPHFYAGTATATWMCSVGSWRSTAAINRIQLLCSATANLATGSQLRIYGRL